MGFTQPDSPSSPSDYASVATSGFDIQAGNDEAAISAAQSGAQAVWGGFSNPSGPREREAQAFMDSDQGYGEFDVTAGYQDRWPNNPDPDTP